MTPRIEMLIDDGNLCGEAPTWDEATNTLLWVDIESSLVFRLDASTLRREVISRGLQVAGIARNQDGRLVFAGATGIHLWTGQDDYRKIVSEHDGESLVFNDMTAGPGGRIYAGTYYWGPAGMKKLGKLYLLHTDGSIQVMDEGFFISNGLGFSPDGSILYYADSGARKIYAYNVHPVTGNLSGRRDFVRISPDEGIPDGLTVDADGFVWSAQWYGSRIVRYDPDGKLERCIFMPVQQVSSVTFGGPDLTDLYVTSAAEYWPSEYVPPGFDESAPMGGALYRVRTGIKGNPDFAADL